MLSELHEKNCHACEGWVPPLSQAQLNTLKDKLDPEWHMDLETQTLTRVFTYKGFAKALMMANLVAYISDTEGHHADIAFGWGYCRISYTSHELARLSENDFICAAKIDAAVTSTALVKGAST